MGARLSVEQHLDHLQEVPVELQGCHILKQLLNARVLDEYLESAEKLLIRYCSIQAVRCEKVIKEVSTHVQEHLADAFGKERAPAHLRVRLLRILVKLLPAT